MRQFEDTAQNPAQYAMESVRMERKAAGGDIQKTPVLPHVAKSCGNLTKSQLGAVGFEPTKAEPSDLQSDPFGHFGTRPETGRPGCAGRLVHNSIFNRPAISSGRYLE